MSARRSASLVVAAIGFATLAACSSSSSSSGSPAAASSPAGAASTPTSPGSAASSPGKLQSIFFANPLPDYPDWGTANACFMSETAKLGVKGVTQGPTGLQVNDQFVLDRISQAIAQNYGALIAVPITPSAYEPLFQRAKSQGMEIATLNTGTATKTQNLEVGTDYTTQGANVAASIGKRPGQQNVGIITNAPGGIGDVIINAFKSHLPANVKVVATAFDAGDPSKTVDVAEQLLTAHPETNILFSWEGTSVAGITTAIKEKGKTGQVFGVVNDLTPQVVDGLRGGTIYGTSQQHFCTMAKDAVDGLVAVSEGKQVPATTDTGTTFVTKSNLGAVLAETKNES
jgi:ABC-type sugar transport system substrate-binding protein